VLLENISDFEFDIVFPRKRGKWIAVCERLGLRVLLTNLSS